MRPAAAFVLLLAVGLSGCFGTTGDGADPEEGPGDSAAPDPTSMSYLQRGGDAARTGSLSGSGPKEYEIAFTTQLPGALVPETPPVFLDGELYVLVQVHVPSAYHPDPPAELQETGLVRVDPQTGENQTVVALDAPPSTMASDGEVLFIAEADRFAAYTLQGEEQWAWSYPDLLPDSPERRTLCVPPAVLDDGLVLACTQVAARDEALRGEPKQFPYGGGSGSADAFVVRLDTISGGDAVWQWPPDAPEGAPIDGGDPQSLIDTGGPCTVSGHGHVAHGLTATEDHVVVTFGPSFEPIDQSPITYLLHDIDGASGDRRWTLCLDSFLTDYPLLAAGDDFAPGRPAVAIQDEAAYVVHDDVIIVDLEEGSFDTLHGPIHNDPIGPGVSAGQQNQQTGLVVNSGSIFVQHYDEIFRIGRFNPFEVAWRYPMDSDNFRQYQPLLAGGVLYVPSYSAVTALDADDGAFHWSHAFERPLSGVPQAPDVRTAVTGLADGMLALVEPDGRLVLLGRTNASIQPVAEVSDPWPASGETVTVDLSGTEPGTASGVDDLDFQVEWGDNTMDEWQADGGFEHVYDESGLTQVRIAVRNGAGQRSVETFTLDVDGTPPQELNFLQEAFAPGNQDLTFGVLGILVALGGGFIALANTHRKRSRLQGELDAIEAIFEEHRSRPNECEAALAERRVHVQGLALEGALEEGQAALLERRIDDLGRQLRLEALDESFQFLPHGMIVRLKDMLADGRISKWEREHILHVLDEDPVLTKTQKRKVRARVDSWFQSDQETGF